MDSPVTTADVGERGSVWSTLLKTAAGLLMSGFFIYLSLRGKDLGAIEAQLAQANYLYLLPYLGMMSLIHFCRTLRWGILLEPLDHEIPFKRLNAVAAVGFMGMIVLPFRLGEFTRPVLMADGKRISFTSATSSIVVERVVDGLMIALLLLGTLPFVHTDSPEIAYVRGAGLIAFAIFGGAAVFLALAYWKRDLALRLARAVGNPVSPKLTERVVSIMDSFLQGLRVVPNPWKIAWFFALSIIYWGLNGAGLGVMGLAFGFHLSALAQATTLGVLIIGIMIPAGPGMVGTFQYFTELGLKLFLPASIVASAGTAYSNLVWAAQFGQQVAFGLFFLFFANAGLSLGGRWGAWKAQPADPSPAAAPAD